MNYPKGTIANLKSADGFMVKLTGISGSMTLPKTVKVEITSPTPTPPPMPPTPPVTSPTLAISARGGTITIVLSGFKSGENVAVEMQEGGVTLDTKFVVVDTFGVGNLNFDVWVGINSYTFMATGNYGSSVVEEFKI